MKDIVIPELGLGVTGYRRGVSFACTVIEVKSL